MDCIKGRIFLVLGLILTGRPGQAAFPDGFNHPELTFWERRSEHFQFIYSPGLEGIVGICSEILETVYEPICRDLQVWPPELTPVVITDYDDVGRNFAGRLEHRIYISQPVVNQARLGRRDWLRYLLAHEFAHVVNYWALRRAYGEWGEWVGMELQPQWFTEGLAEYEGHLQSRQENSYALRAAQEGLLLPLGKMDLASNRIDLVETWLLYAQGHSLVLYMVETYGGDVLSRFFRAYARIPVFEWALRKTLGRGQQKLYREWIAALGGKPKPGVESEPFLEGGEPFWTPLVAALSARWSPDGRKVAVFGVEDWEEPVPGIYLTDGPGGEWQRISDRVDLFSSSQFSWSPESTCLAYVGREQTPQGAIRNGVYLYDLRTATHRRVSGSLRVTDPDWSPTGEWLALVLYEDETTKLALIRPDGSGLRRLTDGTAFQVFQPRWSPRGDQLAVCLIDDVGPDVAILDLNGKIVRRLTSDRWPDRYPEWSPTGETISFISFREDATMLYSLAGEEEGLTGIAANLFSMGTDGSDFRQITRARGGGVFRATWLPDGETMAVSLFRTRNADLWLLPARSGVPASQGKAGGDQEQEEGSEPPKALSPAPRSLTPPQRYRARREIRRLLTRPLTDQDGVGNAFGLRTIWTDPLRQNRLTVEAGYGFESEENSFQFRYENDENRARWGLEVFQRVDPPLLRQEEPFPQRARGVGVFARLPQAPFRSPWIQDVLSLGYEMADHQSLFLSSQGREGEVENRWWEARVGAITARWQRDLRRPNRGSSSYLAHLTWGSDSWGSEVNFTAGGAVYGQRWQVPDLRRSVSLGLEVQSYHGDNWVQNPSDFTLFRARLGYDWRFRDQLYAGGWPYAYLGRAWLSASWEGSDVLEGENREVDPRDRMVLEFRNMGWITRGLSYEMRLGQRFFMEGRRGSEFFSEVNFQVRELGF